MGALTWDGDLVLETAAWRDRLFAMRAEPKRGFLPPTLANVFGRDAQLHRAAWAAWAAAARRSTSCWS